MKTQTENFQSIRREMGVAHKTKVERPKKGGGYRRREKWGNKYD